MKKIFTLITMMALAGMASAQFSITSRNTAFTQNFDAMTTAGTWTNNTTPITGWFAKTDATASITTFALNTGSTTTAGLYSFGSTSASDRALGFATTNAFFGASGTGKAYIGWRLVNNTGAAIEQLTITYTGEQWRKDNTVSQTLVVEFQTGATVTDLTAGTWTSAGAGLTFTSPLITSGATALDGNASANRVTGLTATITFGTPLPNGEEVMIRWVDLNDSGNDHQLAIDDVSVTASSPLPISLVKFEAEKLAEKVKLNWVTATEVNNNKFIVERSANGSDFEYLAEIRGAGNSKELNSYAHVDANPLKGTSYYRLTQIDFDGKSESFAPVAVSTERGALSMEFGAGSLEQGAGSVKQGVWSIYAPEAAEGSVRVSDMSGRLVYEEKVQLKEGYQAYKLNLANNEAGLYLVQLIAGKESITKKIKLN